MAWPVEVCKLLAAAAKWCFEDLESDDRLDAPDPRGGARYTEDTDISRHLAALGIRRTVNADMTSRGACRGFPGRLSGRWQVKGLGAQKYLYLQVRMVLQR